ncbi:MAG: ArsR/SmtB family transcription factor [Caulobacteraceae bacterium]
MVSTPSIATIGALIGNPARANVLTALMDGRALTASELAFAARVSPQTTSGHLAQLADARLLVRRKQGRHAYYALASPRIGAMLEAIMAVAADGPSPNRPGWKGDEALRAARACYDHLAGRLGVALADSLVKEKRIVLGEDGGEVTAKGAPFLAEFGVDLAAIDRPRRAFCRPCLDWSERRFHLAGAVGAALAARFLALGWTLRVRDSRALTVSAAGRDGFARVFGIVAD